MADSPCRAPSSYGRAALGDQRSDLVFRTGTGTALTAHNVRRDLGKALDDVGLTGMGWSPREMPHSFVAGAPQGAAEPRIDAQTAGDRR
ncbi:hypothetical protein [Microtetraspora glauca]|uniref:Tyr recombinase domain-containing protein n=1 Tax=Microtetraspora glauca TaxID=1996 RepID=A0ABV3G8B3_MICGL